MMRRILMFHLFLFVFATGTCSFAAEPVDTASHAVDVDVIVEDEVTDYDRDHWSFQPIVRPNLPGVDATEWPKTPIDHFILSDLESDHQPLPTPASRSVLLRRLKFDLLGLPPTPEELIAFEQDPAPGAYERVVESMLAAPAYGERWAQHWLDLARFAETDGFEHDRVRVAAWKYRQWVIDALNADMPYDEFVRKQLAGDLTSDYNDAIATMFCLAGPDMPDINEQDVRRHDKMNEITSTVGAVLLGLQMHCAQCHDHKYDPISQADFFRLRGIFESSIPEMKRDKPVMRLDSQSQAVSPWLYYRGEVTNQGPTVKPRPPRIADWNSDGTEFDAADPREAFAIWLFDKQNPLTSRVIANRVWQHHFGRGLCDNPSDFGVVAGGPTNPELLDWLASELRDGGWSLKRLHRVIVNSATYQMSDRSEQFPRKRLEGEVIRDALLSVGGQLNQEYGGESVMPPLPPELVETLLPGQWKASPRVADHSRRSIYVFARRNLRFPIFEVFDRPDAGATCARRDKSTTAIQSLQMLNSELTLDSARGLRDRLVRQAGGVDEMIERLFLVTLARRPSPTEARQVRETLGAGSISLQDNLLAVCVAVLNTSEFVYVD